MSLEQEKFEELSLLAAAGAASEEDHAELEGILSLSIERRETHRHHRDAATLLVDALTLPQVVPATSELLAKIASLKVQPPPEPKAMAEVISLASRPSRIAVASLGIFVAAAAALLFLWLRERDSANLMRTTIAALKEARTDAEIRAERARLDQEETLNELRLVEARYQRIKGQKVRLATVANEQGATAKIFINPDENRWLLFAYDLPQITPDKDYQLWFVPKEGTPVSGGILTLQDDGSLGTDVVVPEGVTPEQAAISVEKAGGAETPTMSQIKMIGPLI